MGVVRILLIPFSLLYALATTFRNLLYDSGVLSTKSFSSIKTLAVGNLSAGGTGKTPMVEYLIRLLSETKSTAILSRGYRRETKGFLKGGENSTVRQLGDEPFQILKKYKDVVDVYVGEDRAKATEKILNQGVGTEVLLLDDAFQHRKMGRDLNILLTEYSKPFSRDYILPSGRLRELRMGAKRANILVVTKTPDLVTEEDIDQLENELRDYLAPECPIFFARIDYQNPIRITGESELRLGSKVLVFTGIANPQPFLNYAQSQFIILESKSFKDHHNYSLSDIQALVKSAKDKELAVITTEKDIIKFLSDEAIDCFEKSTVSLYYLPIQFTFLKKGKEFDTIILDCVNS